MFCRGFSNSLLRCLLAGLGLLSGASRVVAGDYLFNLPQLLGTYDFTGDAVEVSADLGMPFAEIERASMIFTGTLTTGSYSIIDEQGLYPLTAGVQAWFDGPDSLSDVYVEKYLPASDGEFELQDTFRVGYFGTGPDFTPWLDGTAEFDFAVVTPFLIAITRTESLPTVTLTSAQLWIEGQPNLDSFMVGPDFDIDGDVDMVDLARWQAAYHLDPTADADGDGDTDGLDFLAWQRSFGLNLDAVAVTVPEPCTLLLLLCAVGGIGAFGRR